MPLNYSKWDQLELSDDSDIEGHPNVDKKSLIRWKQRDIHEKREVRKHQIAQLKADIACNSILLPRIKDIRAGLSSPASTSTTSTTPSVYFNSLVEKLKTNPSPDAPPTNAPNQVSYDAMILTLLLKVSDEARLALKEANVSDSDKEDKLAALLIKGLDTHVVGLSEDIEKKKKELENEEKELKKHITSDDMHDGFANTYIPPTPAPPPIPVTKPKKKVVKETELEVLNPSASSSSIPAAAATPSAKDPEDSDDEEEGVPELTPSLEVFSRIPVGSYEQSFQFIQSHRDVVVEGASDALLVAAFRAQGQFLDGQKDKARYAKQCVHQSLLLQYCEKLGGDGVRVFFKKMVSGDPRAEKVFVDDVESTYKHLVERVKATAQESSEGKEQIQLVPENPQQTISFNVPDGPPPETLVLEGPGTEDMDVEEVRKALQFRWDVFCAFSPELRDALKDGALDSVNKVLGDMEVSNAEAVVEMLDKAGILSFADGGIRDERGIDRDE